MNLLIQVPEERVAADAILNLMNLCSLTVFCLLTASMSLFLDKCFQKGMIFRKYYNLITYWFWLPSKKTDYLVPAIGFIGLVYGFKEQDIIRRPLFTENKFQWLFKILGGCIYCFGTWIYIVLFCFSSRAEISLLGLILGIGLNYFLIEVLLKIKK